MHEVTSNEDLESEAHDALRLLCALGQSDNASYFNGFKYKTIRCTSCPTEVVLECILRSLFTGKLRRRDKHKSFVFSITLYVDMGRMLDPEELEWRSLTTWFKHPGVDGKRSARYEKEDVPRDQWPCIDLTHMEPISERFERGLSVRPRWKPFCDMPVRGRPRFEASGDEGF